jgi:hypothetical protein
MLIITGALVCALYFPANAFATIINEIRIDQPGADTDEYFELTGTPGTSLDGLSYIVIGDGSAGSGVIENVSDLTGQVIPLDGFFLAAESSFSLAGGVDLTTSLNFENSDNVTHMLVSGLSASNGTDLDSNDDGLLDIMPWTAILDSVALLDSSSSGEQIYSSHIVDPVDGSAATHIYRSPDLTGVWQAGQDDTAGVENSPETVNNQVVTVPEPGTLLLLVIGYLILMIWGRTSIPVKHSRPEVLAAT